LDAAKREGGKKVIIPLKARCADKRKKEEKRGGKKNRFFTQPALCCRRSPEAKEKRGEGKKKKKEGANFVNVNEILSQPVEGAGSARPSGRGKGNLVPSEYPFPLRRRKLKVEDGEKKKKGKRKADYSIHNRQNTFLQKKRGK